MSVASQPTTLRTRISNPSLLFGLCGAAACAINVYLAPNLPGMFGALLAILMTAIAYRDAHDFIIPDRYSAAAFALGMAAASVNAEQDAIWAIAAGLLRAAVLALGFLAIRSAYHRLRGRHGLGLGDVKLAAVAGAWLDWTMLPVAVEIAALTALTAALAYQLILRQPLKATTRLPFGLFFAPSIWIGWLLQTLLPWPWP